MPAVVLVFLDGFGIGAATRENPLYMTGLPCLERIAGSKLVTGVHRSAPGILVKGIDATMGVGGLPQSATGQTALFTGVNAAALLGHHLPAFPNSELIRVIRARSLLKQVSDLGLRATFANAYSDDYFTRVDRSILTHSVTTHCVFAARLPFRTMADLRRGAAVYWDFTRKHLGHRPDFPPIPPELAGKHLAGLLTGHDLTLYECFLPDLIGHSASEQDAAQFLTDLDRFLGSVLESLGDQSSLVICSDHGNIEDLSVATHTSNPVPLIAVGPAAGWLADVERIDQVADAVLRALAGKVGWEVTTNSDRLEGGTGGLSPGVDRRGGS